MKSSSKDIPRYTAILWPTLKVLEKLGGSASNQELSEHVAAYMQIPEALQEALHGDTSETEFDYRAAWARTHLKFIGAVTNSARAVWTLTDVGRAINSEEEAKTLVLAIREKRRKERLAKKQVSSAESEEAEAADDQSTELAWEEQLLAVLRDIKPDAFERLCQRLLRESGFIKVEVTGRSGDGGIDGVGVLRVSLLSFQVLFQCKRYKGSVGPSEIRDFRGAMVGRADKGLFITTGRFTREADARPFATVPQL